MEFKFEQAISSIYCLIIYGCKTTEQAAENALICSDIKSCAESIRLRVGEKSKWICNQKSTDKLVVVRSTFSRTGEIIKSNITTASVDTEFNAAAIKAIKEAAPFIELTLLNDKDFEEASVINFVFEGIKEVDNDK